MVVGLLSSPSLASILSLALSEPPSRSFLMMEAAASVAAAPSAALEAAIMAAAAASACSLAICCDRATSTACASPEASGTASEPDSLRGLMRFRFGRPLVDDMEAVEVEGGDAILFMGEWDRWDWGREFSKKELGEDTAGIRERALATAVEATGDC